jgi:phosphoglucosamine mutase
MRERLFGTDGVRGRAGVAPLDVPTIRRIGAALVRAFGNAAGWPALLVGRDTRESGGWIERELAHGARAARASVTSAGIISTPAIAFLTRHEGFDAGVVISASHNPYEDNGINVFSGAAQATDIGREVRRSADAMWRCRGDARCQLRICPRLPRTCEAALPDGRASMAPGRRLRQQGTSALAPRPLADLGLRSRARVRNQTAGTSTSRAGRPNPPGWPAPVTAGWTWAWRSTATATARSSSITSAASSTATR